MKIVRNVYKIPEKDQIKNYEELEKIIQKHLKYADRWEQIGPMLETIEADFASSPASPGGHGAYIGGLVEHILDVIPYVLLIRSVYEQEGLDVPTVEQCVFVSVFHDIGKVTDGKDPNYVPQDSDWHRKNLGFNFKLNDETDAGLEHCDKSLFLLQKFGITMDIEEYQAIRIHDGCNYGGNQLKRYGYSNEICLLTEILRTSDMMAAQKREHLDMQAEKGK
jgi:hypothetical protein